MPNWRYLYRLWPFQNRSQAKGPYLCAECLIQMHSCGSRCSKSQAEVRVFAVVSLSQYVIRLIISYNLLFCKINTEIWKKIRKIFWFREIMKKTSKLFREIYKKLRANFREIREKQKIVENYREFEVNSGMNIAPDLRSEFHSSSGSKVLK